MYTSHKIDSLHEADTILS